MNLFEYSDYKKWVNDRIAAMPKGGRGQYMRIVEHLGTNSAIVTQIFKGPRDLTAEQAVLLARYFGFSQQERRFFLLLVNYSRAGSHVYREILQEEIREARAQANEIKGRVSQDTQLSSEVKATLYSNWYYLAIWSLTAIPGFDNIDVIRKHLGISQKKANEALDFLLRFKFVRSVNEKLAVGPTLFHLESDSPHVSRHHQNWRTKAFANYDNQGRRDLSYTAPVTLSAEDAKKVRARILSFISETVATIGVSPSEEMFCLCVDWFQI